LIGAELSTVATRRTQAERSATTRAALLSAARELFAERGFAATGRDDIAERAGVTRGALYHHFENKEAVLRAVVAGMEAELAQRIGVAVRRASPGIEQLRAGALAYIEACADDPAMRRVALLDAPAVLGWAECRAITAANWLDATRAALALATGRAETDPDVDITANLLLGALSEAVLLLATADSPVRMRRRLAANFSSFLDRLVAA
jgi:AcrR family transcriptional regulator